MNPHRPTHSIAPPSPRCARLRVFGVASLIAGFSVAWTDPAQAADAASFDAAVGEFQRANSGVDSAIETAAERFGALLTAEPADPVLLAYSGAAMALRARSTLLPWKKMSHAEDGLAQLDKALALLTPTHDATGYRGTPASLEARFTAASVFLALPGLFNRHARGAKLLDEVSSSPLLANASLSFRGAVWYRAGTEALAASRPDDARRLLQQVIVSGAPQADRAQAKLEEIAP
jgi:hypothetical protein